MAWIQLTPKSTNKKSYYNTAHIYQVTSDGKSGRIMIAVQIQGNPQTSLMPLAIDVAESFDEVMERIVGTGEQVISKLGS